MEFDHSFDTITAKLDSNITIGGTGSFIVPSGTPAERPFQFTNGMIRFNSSLGLFETCAGGVWSPAIGTVGRNYGSLCCDFIGSMRVIAGTATNQTSTPTVLNGDWALSTNGTGASILSIGNSVNTTDRALGVISLTTGTTTTGRSVIGTHPSAISFGYAYHYAEWRVYIPTLPTVAQDFDIHVGFIDSHDTIDTGVDGAFFFHDRATSANWLCVTRQASNQNTITSATPVVAGTWLKMAVVDDGTTTYFYINDSLTGSTTLQRPTANTQQFGLGCKIQKSAGLTSASVFVDYVNYFYTITTTR